MTESDVIRLGIKGLDAIFLGGVPKKNVILVEGRAGTGKTLLGMEFIYRGMVEFDEPGIILVFETSPDNLMRDALSMGWDFQELQARRKLQIVFTSPQVLDQELRAPDSLLLETAAEIGARRIFIDGIGLLTQSGRGAGPAPAASGAAYHRETLQQLIETLNRENLTAMLSHEIGNIPDTQTTLEASDFLADTVIRLRQSHRNRRVQRSIEIVKSRGQDYDSGEHTLAITSGKGLEVFRRVQSPIRGPALQPTSESKRSVIGVDVLDKLIGGGVFDGSTTMVVGISGVGKTVLGTQILREGAMKQNKRGLLVSLDEHPAQIVRNAETIGLDLQAQINSGIIHLMFESPQELEIDSHFARIVRLIEDNNIQRLVVDGMTSYSTALGDQGLYRDFFHALVAYSKSHLMTTFFNYENPEFLGISSFMPNFPVNSIVDNIILMSLVELGSGIRRCMTVVKSRGTRHEFDSREYVIGQGGIQLVPGGDLPGPMPFENYTSILSRAPSRFPAPRQTRDEAPLESSK